MSLTHSLRQEAEPYARRLERLSKRTHSSLDDQNPPPNNLLAHALNQTFQFNSTSAPSHVPTTSLSFDTISPVGNPVTSPTVKPQYRDFGVQKNINFTRNTTTSQPSEDLSSCIMRLEAENRDLQGQVEKHKRESEGYRGSLDEIKRWYNSSGPHHHLRPPPPSGSSNFTAHPPQEFSTHPRWRSRNPISNSQVHSMDVQESDHPPIETLSPSSSESVSASPHRRTPMESCSFKMRARGDAQGSQIKPYPGAQQHGRRRGPTEPMNGRRRRGKLRGPPSFGRSGKLAGSPAPPNSSATVEAGVPGTSPRIDATAVHDKVNDED